MDNNILILGLVLVLIVAGYAAYESNNAKQVAPGQARTYAKIAEERMRLDAADASLQSHMQAAEQNIALAQVEAVKWIGESCTSEALRLSPGVDSCNSYCASFGRKCLLTQNSKTPQKPGGNNYYDFEVAGCRASYGNLPEIQSPYGTDATVKCVCC